MGEETREDDLQELDRRRDVVFDIGDYDELIQHIYIHRLQSVHIKHPWMQRSAGKWSRSESTYNTLQESDTT